jgi:hypothetical protein
VIDSVRNSLDVQIISEDEDARLLDNDVEMGVIDRASGTYLSSLNIEYAPLGMR